MSTINTLNNIQQQVTALAPSSVTETEATLGGETFETALDIAMDAKSLVLPGAANLAIDTGVEILEEKGLLSTAYDATSIKDGIENVFDELTTGIASSFIAALSGADSATAVTESSALTTNAQTTTEGVSTDSTNDEGTQLIAQSVATTKTVLDGVTPYLKSSATPIAGVASVTLSALEELLLETDEEKEKYKN